MSVASGRGEEANDLRKLTGVAKQLKAQTTIDKTYRIKQNRVQKHVVPRLSATFLRFSLIVIEFPCPYYIFIYFHRFRCNYDMEKLSCNRACMHACMHACRHAYYACVAFRSGLSPSAPSATTWDCDFGAIGALGSAGWEAHDALHACMHACMCARTHACMYLCMHACMYVCMYACMYVCMCVCTYACMYLCMHVCMYVCM